MAIPAKFLNEFMNNPRLKEIHSPIGTRPVDLKVFREVIRDVLSNKAFVQTFVNDALKKGQFRM